MSIQSNVAVLSPDHSAGENYIRRVYYGQDVVTQWNEVMDDDVILCTIRASILHASMALLHCLGQELAKKIVQAGMMRSTIWNIKKQ